MKPWSLGGVSVAALIAIPCAGWSLTAQEAWDKWQETVTSYGQSLSNDGVETMDGTLTVRGLASTMEMDGAVAAMQLGDVTFAEQGDGTVLITLPESAPLTLSGTDAATGEKFDLTASFEMPGAKVVAAEEGGMATITYDLPSLSAQITELKVDDQPLPMKMNLAVTNSVGSYRVSSEPGAPMETSFEAAGMTIDMDVADPEGSGKLVLSASIEGVTGQSKGVAPADPGSDDVAKMLMDGFDVDGSASYGPVAFKMDFEEDGSSANAVGSLTGGGIGFAMGADGLSYDVSYEGLDLAVSGSDIPFPQVTLKAASAGTALAIPVLMQDEMAPFSLRTALEGVEIGEEIWSLFDPAGVLARDPAALVIDLAGSGRWSIDIFDEAAMMAVETSGEAPGEVEAVEIREVRLAVGGAELTGSGAFTLDNSDLQTFNGMPRPEGSASFTLVGGNALLESLEKLGIVQPQQAMTVRAMAGFFAKPGAGADELKTEVAIDGNGQVLVNGGALPF